MEEQKRNDMIKRIPNASDQHVPLGKRIFDSGLWMIAWQWGSRSIGFVSTVILARLLTPHDYGIVAMAMLVVNFLEIVTVLGGEKYLISKPEIDDEDLYTAWTIRLIQFTLVSFVLFLSAPVVSLFFNEPKLSLLIPVLSLGVFVSGFESVGSVTHKRALSFSRVFYFGIIQKLIGFVVTVALALLLGNYWAIAIGFLALRISGTVLSYLMFRFRPKFTISRIKSQWAFSQWILAGNCAVYFRNKLDQICVSRFFSTGDLGRFNMASDISSLPTTEVAIPAIQAIFPGLVQQVDDPQGLELAFVKVMGALACIVMPLSLGLVAVADNAVKLLLGDKWGSIAVLVQVLAVMAIPVAFSMVAITLMTLKNLVRLSSLIDWAMVVCMVPVLFVAALYADLKMFAVVRTGLAFLGCFLYFAILHLRVMNQRRAISAVIRPLLAATGMLITIRALGLSVIGVLSVDLVLQITLGAAVYLPLLYFIWILAGCPPSGEKIIYDMLVQKLPGRKPCRAAKGVPIG